MQEPTLIIRQLKELQGGLSLRVFAKKLRVSAPFLSDIYRGNRNTGPKLMRGYSRLVARKEAGLKW
jgi:hypothetical protein